PPVWYVAHLRGDGYNVIGASLPGAPGIVVGHNEHIAWGVTLAMTDGQDLFLEKADPDNSHRFAWRDGWYDGRVVQEDIRVRGDGAPAREGATTPRHGPLLNGTLDIPTSGAPIALRCCTDDGPGPLDAQLRLNRAADWESFQQALAGWTFPPLNFVYADTA